MRVYTGVPTPARDRVGNAATQRRIAAWVSDAPDLVEVFPRPLRYPPPGGREKGVDVELAIDLVRLAMDDEFDAAVIASADTDLLPPIEFVTERFPHKIIETVAYSPEPGCEAVTAEPIDLAGGRIHARHRIKKSVFEKAVADRRNFRNPRSGSQPRVEQARWGRIRKRFSA